jgi:hypothetical protein
LTDITDDASALVIRLDRPALQAFLCKRLKQRSNTDYSFAGLVGNRFEALNGAKCRDKPRKHLRIGFQRTQTFSGLHANDFGDSEHEADIVLRTSDFEAARRLDVAGSRTSYKAKFDMRLSNALVIPAEPHASGRGVDALGPYPSTLEVMVKRGGGRNPARTRRRNKITSADDQSGHSDDCRQGYLFAPPHLWTR